MKTVTYDLSIDWKMINDHTEKALNYFKNKQMTEGLKVKIIEWVRSKSKNAVTLKHL